MLLLVTTFGFFGNIPSYGYVTTYLPTSLSKTSYVVSSCSYHEKTAMNCIVQGFFCECVFLFLLK